MTDSWRRLHDKAHAEWRDEQADEFAELQRQAFKAGFEAAAFESASFRLLREWLEEQRDESARKYDERGDDMHFARQMAFKEVLVKLSEMGCRPLPDDADTPGDGPDPLQELHQRYTTLEGAVEAAVNDLRANSRPGQTERAIADGLEKALDGKGHYVTEESE
jgi:hypothetical protein